MVCEIMGKCTQVHSFKQFITEIHQSKTTKNHAVNTSLKITAKYPTANYFPKTKCHCWENTHCQHVFETLTFLSMRYNVSITQR